MKHVKTTLKGFGFLFLICGLASFVSYVLSLIDTDYIIYAVCFSWIVLMSFLIGATYESYKELKNVKPY